MVWEHIPKEEAQQMAQVWAIQDQRTRERREALEPPVDPPQGSTTTDPSSPTGRLGDSRPSPQNIPNERLPEDDFVTPELLNALSKIFGEVHAERREKSKRLGGVDYRLWAVDVEGNILLEGSIYRHPKIKFRTSMNGKFDFGEGRQGSFIFDWDTRLGADQPIGKEGLLYTKEVYGEQPIFSECPSCKNKSLLQRGPQGACHACSRSEPFTIRAYKLMAELGMKAGSFKGLAQRSIPSYRNYMTLLTSENVEAIRTERQRQLHKIVDPDEKDLPPSLHRSGMGREFYCDLVKLVGPIKMSPPEYHRGRPLWRISADPIKEGEARGKIWQDKENRWHVALRMDLRGRRTLALSLRYKGRSTDSSQFAKVADRFDGYLDRFRFEDSMVRIEKRATDCQMCGKKTLLESPKFKSCFACARTSFP